ncbi:helix-turn-helix domain-containing protein [Streptomyces phyllanthi]|uniref:helix-turn-helix domain-containing protein n=1 Tax=Streptomyces phyllanthi TaxID=1803180 RepID=UPI001D152A4A
MSEARRRLRRGQSVAGVAHALGFADQAHFHSHFAVAYAVTPGRYRRLSQINIWSVATRCCWPPASPWS